MSDGRMRFAVAVVALGMVQVACGRLPPGPDVVAADDVATDVPGSDVQRPGDVAADRGPGPDVATDVRDAMDAPATDAVTADTTPGGDARGDVGMDAPVVGMDAPVVGMDTPVVGMDAPVVGMDAPGSDGVADVAADGGSDAPGGDDFDAYFMLPARPLTIGYTVDATHAGRATIPAAGGVVTTTAADGTVFTLTLPRGALSSPIEITLTPLVTATALPLGGGLVAGVQAEPEGLELLIPATLAITRPAAVSLAAGQEVVGFGARGDGTGFYLSPAQGASLAAFELRVPHFSATAIAVGLTDEVQHIRTESPPSRRAERALHALVPIDTAHPGADARDREVFLAWARQQASDVAILEATLTEDPAQTLALFVEYAIWSEEITWTRVTGLDATRSAAAALFAELLRRQARLSYAACNAHHLAHFRDFVRLGLLVADVTGLDARLAAEVPSGAEIMVDPDRCNQFTLNLDSEFEVASGSGSSYRVHTQAEIFFEYRPNHLAGGTINGPRSEVLHDLDEGLNCPNNPDCPQLCHYTDGGITLADVHLGFDGSTPQFLASFNPNDPAPTEGAVAACAGGIDITDSYWSHLWDRYHGDVYDVVANRFAFGGGWTANPDGDPVLANLNVRRPLPLLPSGSQEITSLILTHEPAP